MTDQQQQPNCPTEPAKSGTKRKHVFDKVMNKKRLDQERGKTRINIGVTAFPRWRQLREAKCLQNDAMVALFLLDSYEQTTTSTPLVHGFARPPAPDVSTIFSDSTSTYKHGTNFNIAGIQQFESSESEEASSHDLDTNTYVLERDVADDFNDIRNTIIDWDDDTWHPDMETETSESSEEYDTKEIDSDSDDSDADYCPRICVRSRYTSKMPIHLDDIQPISMEDTVHDALDSHEPHITETPTSKESLKVLVVDDVIGHPASIAYHDSLKQLAQFLDLPIQTCKAKECGASKPFEISVTSRGTAAVIEWVCSSGHTVWKWSSQPTMKYGMLVGDFMMATNILLSGNNYAKISLLFKFMNMGMVKKPVFFKIQDTYCVDTIKEFWHSKRAEVINQLKSKESIVVLGDARMDSPGFCAQYCTYSSMDNETKKIICMVNIDKRETQRNSVIMEKEGFIRSFETLCHELQVTEFCTDAHAQISALFNKGKYKDSGVMHTLDIWHGAKCLGKKVYTAGQQKDCTILQSWNKDICNHFWYCCKVADTYDDFFDKWVGLLHHVTGEHAWALGACDHGPLLEQRDKEWFEKGSKAHQTLTRIILDARWLKNVHKFLPFRSTSELESFHNHLLMYASKRFSFSPPVYAARTMLAGLDYNHHVNRPVRRKADGSIQYGKIYNKRSRRWRLYALKEEKNYSYIADLQGAILMKRLSGSERVQQRRPPKPGDPRLLGVLSGVPAPSTQELLQTQMSRGTGQSLQNQ
ncbi:uncharacterized protein [Misgurnus anguillicaudatus]|uniref:uncharacterized protein n=1 Tax=Misgurnus anguillicaudatus TaxID=75329 RepID=UPI003CCF64C6